jgi:hypothetical protein
LFFEAGLIVPAMWPLAPRMKVAFEPSVSALL